MTHNADFKHLVRERMTRTGETYAAARAALTARALEPAEAAFRDKTLRTFLDEGRLISIPTRRKARAVILLELVRRFDPERQYDEREVSDILAEVHEDFAFWRRELVDAGFLARDNGVYWVNRVQPRREGNHAQEFGMADAAWFASLNATHKPGRPPNGSRPGSLRAR